MPLLYIYYELRTTYINQASNYETNERIHVLHRTGRAAANKPNSSNRSLGVTSVVETQRLVQYYRNHIHAYST
jgi:hypothetical protein